MNLLHRRQRGQYRARAAPAIEFGFRDPETNALCDPNPKQRLALESEAEHIFYGGAVGGGKTVWLVFVAILTCLLHPGVHVAIFRRHYTELAQNVIGQFMALLPPKYGRFNGQLRCYTFPNGSVCWFGHCARDNDVYLYQGNQWVKLLIDEAGHFTQFIIGYLSTRVRSPRRDVFLQVLMGSNPGGAGHGYLKRGWVQPQGWEISHLPRQPQPMEVWRPRAPKTRPKLYTRSRQYVPAFFAENYILLAADPLYLDRILGELGTTRGQAKGVQLAEGNWDVNDGMMFADDWQADHIVSRSDEALLSLGFQEHQVIPWHVKRFPQLWVPHPSAQIFGSVDYGYGAPFSFHLHAIMPGGHVRTFAELYQAGVRDVHQARWIRATIEKYMDLGVAKPEWIVYDPQMDGDRAEVNVSETIADIYHRELGDPLQIKLQPGGKEAGARLSRIQRIKDALAPTADGFPHWDVTDNCEHLIRTLPDLPADEDNPEVLDDGAEDHAYEECGRFFQMHPAPTRSSIPSELDELDPLSRAHQIEMAKRFGEIPTDKTVLNLRNLSRL